MQHTNAIAWTAGLVCLAAGIAGAQQTMPGFMPVTQIQSSGMAGITAGQTARLSALNPGVPAPLATGARCPVHVAFMDDQGTLLKSADIIVDPGKSASVDLNRDTDISTSTPRLQIRAVLTFTPSTPPPTSVMPGSGSGFTGFVSIVACRLIPTLEIFDNASSKTQFVLSDFGFTYPLALTSGVFTSGGVR